MKTNKDQNLRYACADVIGECVYDSIISCCHTLRKDVLQTISVTLSEMEASNNKCTREYCILESIVENAEIGQHDKVPICQDTGSVWVRLEIGPNIIADGSVFSKINENVSKAYFDAKGRMSMVADAIFDRSNTGDNTPAFCDIKPSAVPGARLSVMLKGGGSDNASKVVMLAPGKGWEGIKSEVIECVRQKAVNACPPLIVGIGIGSTFDKVAGLAKYALLRPLGSTMTDSKYPQVSQYERELLELINSTGIGPAGLGGYPTALAVHIESAPCHIAALPLAINMGCCAMRSKTQDITALLPQISI